MLARFRERRAARKAELETRLAVVDAVYGRLDGEDAAEADAKMLDDLLVAPDLNDPIDNQMLIQMLEAQLETTIAMLADANKIVEAAREFAKLITAINQTTGEAVFRTVRDDDLAASLLNHRYSDLASLLNGNGPKVPGKLSQGTVH
jgi:hypothetical protein